MTIEAILDVVVQTCLGGEVTLSLPAGEVPPVRAPSSLGPRLPLVVTHSKLLRRAAVIAKEVRRSHYPPPLSSRARNRALAQKRTAAAARQRPYSLVRA